VEVDPIVRGAKLYKYLLDSRHGHTRQEIEQHLGISVAQAKRYLSRIELVTPLIRGRRDRGGSGAPLATYRIEQ